jgi:hypothetical protein
LSAQIGGRYAFESLSLPVNARVTALGGTVINVIDDDVSLAQLNPALTDSLMDNQLAINHNFYFAGIQNGNIAFGKSLKKLGVHTHIAINYVDYGNFQLTDEIGNVNGEFSAGEIGLIVGAGKRLNERIRGGVNLKILSASYESYNAIGLGIDVGFHYQKPGANYSWALVLRNFGGEMTALVDEKRFLPFEIQLGYTRKLAHLPFRFSIVGQNLQKWYVRFDDPDVDNQTDIFNNVSSKSGFSKSVDNIFRHLIFNGEFLIGSAEQFRLRFGYNHLRKQELKVTTFRSLAGFSLGFGFNIKKIKFDYGLGYYHISGATNHLSIRLNMDRIFNKV